MKVFLKLANGKKITVKRVKLPYAPGGGVLRINLPTKGRLNAANAYKILAYTYCGNAQQKHALALDTVHLEAISPGSPATADGVQALPEMYSSSSSGSGSGSGSGSFVFTEDLEDLGEDDIDEDEDEDKDEDRDEDKDENEDKDKDEDEDETLDEEGDESTDEGEEVIQGKADELESQEEEKKGDFENLPPARTPLTESNNEEDQDEDAKSLADAKVAAAVADGGAGSVLSFQQNIATARSEGNQKFGTAIGIVVAVLVFGALFIVAVRKRLGDSSSSNTNNNTTLLTTASNNGSNMSLDIPASFGRMPSTVSNNNFSSSIMYVTTPSPPLIHFVLG